MSRWRPIIYVALIVLAAVVVAVVMRTVESGSPTGSSDPFNQKRFSVGEWSSASREDRARMCRDLIDRHLPPGTTEQQVLALLGKPEYVNHGDKFPQRAIADRFYVYSIGNWSWQGMDDAFLYVHLDKGDRVVKAEIYGY
jgi:hypothetical protein